MITDRITFNLITIINSLSLVEHGIHNLNVQEKDCLITYHSDKLNSMIKLLQDIQKK